jgi:hypothetical protein
MTREIVVFRYITELLLLYPLFTMHAAAPDGTPPRRIGDEKIKKTPCPPFLRETLRWGSFLESTIFMVLA